MSTAVVTVATVTGGGIPAAIVVGLFVGGIIAAKATAKMIENSEKEKIAFKSKETMKQIYETLLLKVKEIEINFQEKYRVFFDFSDSLEKIYHKDLEKFDQNDFFDKISNFRKEAHNFIFELNQIQMESLLPMEIKIKNINNQINTLQPHNKLNQKLENINTLYKKSLETLFFKDKIKLINTLNRDIKEYQEEYEIITKQEELIEYVNSSEFDLKEEKVVIVSKREKLINKIIDFKEKIKNYDTNYNRFEDFKIFSEDRLSLVLDSIKLDYGKIKNSFISTKIYKGELQNLLPILADENIKIKVKSLLLQNRVSKSEFNSISTEISELILSHQQKLSFIESLKNSLSKLGYQVLDDNSEIMEKLESGEIVYLDTDEEYYKIMLKVKENSLTTRFVRVVASQKQKETISSYQKQKDEEAAKNWCKNYDKLSSFLEKEGIVLDEKLRIEPMQEAIMYIIDEKLATQKREKKEKVLNKKSLK